MIFVVLGTQRFQLNRLLAEVDDLIEQGEITQEVIAQIGASDYEPKHYKYYRYLDKNRFDDFINQSTLVISHSGVGSIITALKARKPTIVYPRLLKYHEHVDDHQLDIAKAFEKKNYVICRSEGDSLAQIMKRCGRYPFAEYISNTSKIMGIVKDYMEEHAKPGKLCFAASSGGHLEEISRLAGLRDQYEIFLVTEKGGFAELNICNSVYYLSQINRKEILFIPKLIKTFFQSLRVLLKEKPYYIISTGALATFPICLLGKLMRKQVIYIESFARVDTASLTGRLMYHIADLFIIQWEELQDIFPKAVYGGGIF